MSEITNREKYFCADREVRQRERVYPRLVVAGKMPQHRADKEIATMKAIAADYEAKAQADEQQGRLF